MSQNKHPKGRQVILRIDFYPTTSNKKFHTELAWIPSSGNIDKWIAQQSSIKRGVDSWKSKHPSDVRLYFMGSFGSKTYHEKLRRKLDNDKDWSQEKWIFDFEKTPEFTASFDDREMLKLLVFLLLITSILCDKESVHHGAPSSRFQEIHEKDGHDPHLDHQAILGSKKTAQEFDDLTPEESKKRLRVLAKKMDKNSDGFVDQQELQDWIHKSMLSLDKEETDERFDEIDADKNNVITWAEYVQEAFGSGAHENEKLITDPEDRKLLEEDRQYFNAADLNKDGKLTREEFDAFQNPEHHRHMHDTLVKNTLVEKDANKDGKIDLREFLGEMADQPKSEWYVTEKIRFEEEYDKNKDGFLEGEELRQWLVPDVNQNAQSEAEHLISMSDADHDGKLSIDEIVNQYALFVGSEATNYGEHLTNIDHTEL